MMTKQFLYRGLMTAAMSMWIISACGSSTSNQSDLLGKPTPKECFRYVDTANRYYNMAEKAEKAMETYYLRYSNCGSTDRYCQDFNFKMFNFQADLTEKYTKLNLQYYHLFQDRCHGSLTP